MQDHDDVYVLIATTATTLRRAVEKLGPKVKFPKPVTHLTESLKEAHDCSGTIKAMKEFIKVYGH